MPDLVESFGSSFECPECPFLFVFDLCLSEEEALTIMRQVVRTHARFQHGNESHFDMKVYTIESGAYRAAERRSLDN